jgi:hypothetical protein
MSPYQTDRIYKCFSMNAAIERRNGLPIGGMFRAVFFANVEFMGPDDPSRNLCLGVCS